MRQERNNRQIRETGGTRGMIRETGEEPKARDERQERNQKRET